MRLWTTTLLVVTAVSALLGCGSPAADPAPRPTEVVLDEAGHPAGIEQHRRWSERIGQGGQPQGEVAFQNLAALGYRTVLSVDGAKTDVEIAAKYGLRYVHVPIEYSGIGHDQALRIVQAVKTSDGPVFVHCHHGLHRGPAGAMIARIAVDGISNEEAVKELKESHCSSKYEGLYRDVGAFQAPSEAELSTVPTELPSYVSPGDLAEHMAVASRVFERLGQCEKAGWSAPASSPDVSPPHEATMLWEGFREMQRLDGHGGDDPNWAKWLKRTEEQGVALEEALRAKEPAKASSALQEIKKTCDSCHASYRDK